MRNNPGGYLEVANDLASWFVERGTLIVSERFRSGEDQKFLATGNGALKNIPIVILLNKGSASASEILAGALRDLRGAKIIGEKSYGKGTVQEVMDLKDGSSLKVTIAHWVMPSGKILDHNGIEPDYLVEPTDEEITKKDDVQLKKAIEVLTAQINRSPLPSVAKTK
jgi:carboxyl-terminal processing protease